MGTAAIWDTHNTIREKKLEVEATAEGTCMLSQRALAQVPVLLPNQLPVNAHSGRQQVADQVPGVLPSRQESQMVFQALGLSLVQLWLLRAFGSAPAEGSYLLG